METSDSKKYTLIDILDGLKFVSELNNTISYIIDVSISFDGKTKMWVGSETAENAHKRFIGLLDAEVIRFASHENCGTFMGGPSYATTYEVVVKR